MTEIIKKSDGWWITGLPDETCPEAGPYDTKAEAEENDRGMRRYARWGQDPKFWSIDWDEGSD